MQTDVMRDSAQLAKENLTLMLKKVSKHHALRVGIQTYDPLTNALSKVCLWIIQYDKATDEQKASPEMFESWFASQELATEIHDYWWDILNTVRNRWLDLFYEEMMRTDDGVESEAA